MPGQAIALLCGAPALVVNAGWVFCAVTLAAMMVVTLRREVDLAAEPADNGAKFGRDAP